MGVHSKKYIGMGEKVSHHRRQLHPSLSHIAGGHLRQHTAQGAVTSFAVVTAFLSWQY